jgi:hypothetical protein
VGQKAGWPRFGLAQASQRWTFISLTNLATFKEFGS